MKKKPRHQHCCPNCENADENFIQDNGERPNDPDFTLLCVALVKPDAWAFGSDEKPYPDQYQYDANGSVLVPCGMQWCPNDR